jgi:hypothetical protein
MTPQERELLAGFLQQLGQAKADPKDAAADSLIRDAISKQPDSDYLLVQRAMGLDLALKAAQGQIAKLQAELDQARPAGGGGFLDNTNAWGRQSVSAGPSAPLAPLATAPAPRSPGMAAAAPASAWGSGLMANLASTAAGVVAGSFLYQGIQNLMGHHTAGTELGNTGLGNSGTNAPLAGSTNDSPSDDDIATALDDDAADDPGSFDDDGSDLA